MVKAGYSAYGPVKIKVAGKEKSYGFMESSVYMKVKRGTPPTAWAEAEMNGTPWRATPRAREALKKAETRSRLGRARGRAQHQGAARRVEFMIDVTTAPLPVASLDPR